MDKYRIRLENSRMYPRSVFWYIEEYSDNLGYYRQVKHGLVSFWGKKAALRAARKGLAKYQKFHDYNELYSLDGELLDQPSPSYVVIDEEFTGDAYCVKCKDKREFTGKIKTSESGRRMATGKCPKCGTKVARILGKAQ